MMLVALSLISLSLLPPVANGSPALHTFIYKHCSAAKPHSPSTPLAGTRQALLHQLLPHASHSKFFKTGVAPDHQLALWGHFQCRGDLTADECHACVTNISSNTWCADSSSARIQLAGCHLQYEADGSEIPGADLTHSQCGGGGGAAAAGFEEGVGAALEAVESGVAESPSGYCSVDVEGVYAEAQCAEGLSGCECGECVAEAARAAEGECAGSLSGRVYEDLCFVSFEFRGEGGPAYSDHGRTGKGIGSSGKLVAIAAGGVALVLVGIILLKKSFNKDDDL